MENFPGTTYEAPSEPESSPESKDKKDARKKKVYAPIVVDLEKLRTDTDVPPDTLRKTEEVREKQEEAEKAAQSSETEEEVVEEQIDAALEGDLAGTTTTTVEAPSMVGTPAFEIPTEPAEVTGAQNEPEDEPESELLKKGGDEYELLPSEPDTPAETEPDHPVEAEESDEGGDDGGESPPPPEGPPSGPPPGEGPPAGPPPESAPTPGSPETPPPAPTTHRPPPRPGPGPTPPRVPPFGPVDLGPAYPSSAPSSPEVVVDTKAITAAEKRGEKRGIVRGFLTGAIVGWYVERRHRKRVEKRKNKEIKGLSGQVDKLEQDQYWDRREMAAHKSAAEERLKELDHTKVIVEQLHQEAARQETAPVPAAVNTITNGEPNRVEYIRTEVAPGAGGQQTPEMAQAGLRPEQPLTQAQAQPESEEPETLRPDRRLESSIWHHIEIDKRTGQAVEQPQFAYGKEYEHERGREIKREDAAITDVPGGIAPTQDATQGQTPVAPSQLGSTATSGMSPAGPTPPAQKPAGEPLSPSKQVLSYAKNPIFWLIAILIVLALFALGVLR